MNKQEHNALLKQCAVVGGLGYSCVHCRREFQKKTTMSNHLGACTLMNMDPRKAAEEVGETVIYTHEQLSRQVEVLVRQMRFLQDQVKSLKLVKKKKITILGWLNAKTATGQCIRPAPMNSTEFWQTCIPTLEILREDIVNGNLFTGITRVIQESVHEAGGKGQIPLRCFTTRPDVMYHFTSLSQWEVCPLPVFDKWIKDIGHGFFKLFTTGTNTDLDQMVQNMAKLLKWSDTHFVQTVKRWVRQHIMQEIESINMIEVNVHDN